MCKNRECIYPKHLQHLHDTYKQREGPVPYRFAPVPEMTKIEHDEWVASLRPTRVERKIMYGPEPEEDIIILTLRPSVERK